MSRLLRRISILILFAGVLCPGCSTNEAPAVNTASSSFKNVRAELLARQLEQIRPFFQTMGKPGTSDWLSSHYEPGQTFQQYLDLRPKLPDERRSKIYILPLGKFSTADRQTISTTAEFVSQFYDMAIVQMPPRPLAVNESNWRRSRYRGGRQVKSGYILEQILKPIPLPQDAAALLAFTHEDLYSNESTSYLFGQVDLDGAVGVLSLSRPKEKATRAVFLQRTLKIAIHETGHLFSIKHCTAYECVMSGTNHLAEIDRRPLDACPADTAKICWFSEVEPRVRYQTLANHCSKIGLADEAKDYQRKAAGVAK